MNNTNEQDDYKRHKNRLFAHLYGGTQITGDDQLDFVHNQLKYRGFTRDVPSATWTHPDGHAIREIALIRSTEPVAVLHEFLSSCGQ